VNSIDFNWPAVIAATVFAAVLGALWYSPVLFLNRWMELRGVTREGTQGAISPAAAVAGSVLLNLIAMTTLSMVVGWSGASTLLDGLVVGGMVGLGFVVTMAARAVLFEDQGAQLFAINNVYTMLIFLVGGAILGAWA
jgi:hypothetical protein